MARFAVLLCLASASASHYGNPFNGPCLSDETNITNVEGGGAICLPQCGAGKKCPTDEPQGMSARPSCFHSEGGHKYCIPKCKAASDCGASGQCNGKQECTYTGHSGPTPPPVPTPSPPPPVPTPPTPPTPAGVPRIAEQYTAQVTSKTTGDIPGLPKGTQTYTEYYDFANKRRRLDFTSQGFSKIYRYDVNDMGHNPFPAPRGYQLNPANPKQHCCWLWLTDSSDPSNMTNLAMTEVQVPPKSTDEGPCSINGVTAEHWHAKGGIVVLESQSDWFVSNGSVLVQQNSQFRYKLKDAIGNVTYKNYDPSLIDVSIFAVPTSECEDCKPQEYGDCKQFGKDPDCDMANYDRTGDEFYFR